MSLFILFDLLLPISKPENFAYEYPYLVYNDQLNGKYCFYTFLFNLVLYNVEIII